MVFSLTIAQGSSNHKQIRDARSLTLPSYAILDEQAEPLIASGGKVGYVSSVTGGAIISFSLKTGKLISSMVVGTNIGPLSMVELGDRRLIAVPAANDPDQGSPASISIIDATSARRLNLHSLLMLPPAAHITPSTRAILTSDGKFCLIASSFDEPALYCFDIETGQITSELPLLGRPSETALYDQGGKRIIAIVSAAANHLSIFRVDDEGMLSSSASFTPSDARFEESNNPVFSASGRSIYIAAATGDQLIAIDSKSGAQFASIGVIAPQRISVASRPEGGEIIGVVSISRPANNRSNGVTTIISRGGALAIQAEFTPPSDITFSRANNVEFDEDGSSAFVGSATGWLFAFNADTGELEAPQNIGSELRRIALNKESRTLAVMRSSSGGDEVVIVNFDLVSEEEEDPAPPVQVPVISLLKPNTVEQGRLKGIKVLVKGENLEGGTLVINGQDVPSNQVRKGLEAKLNKELFDFPGFISVQVKSPDGLLSQVAPLTVLMATAPTIDKIKPEEVAGPSPAFTLKVTGSNFRSSSTIFVGDQPLNTERASDTELRAEVPANQARRVRTLTVQVKDLAVESLISNEKPLVIYGPRITALEPVEDKVIAGAGSFRMRIKGENFREGAQVEINDIAVETDRIGHATDTNLKLTVPGRFARDAGKLKFVVRNPDGSVSEPMEIDALAPAITEVTPGRVLAGISEAKVNIRGENFQKHLRVYVGKDNVGAFRVDKKRVRFHGQKNQIVVSLKGDELGQLLAQPGTLKFMVVNPNKDADGVPSAEEPLEVVGPQINNVLIKPIAGNESQVNLRIEGVNFRKQAIVEFVKDGAVVRQSTPVKVRDDRLTVSIGAKKIDGMGSFQVRVVNPGDVRSNAVEPRVTGNLAGNDD